MQVVTITVPEGVRVVVQDEHSNTLTAVGYVGSVVVGETAIPSSTMPTFCLVYQGGMANLFRCTHNDRQRVAQGDFRTCEDMAMGAHLAGAEVGVFHCDMAGDIRWQVWEPDCGDLFRQAKRYTNATFRKPAAPTCP